ncbi:MULTISPECIES: hypothetical protein [unclassified Wenzhouxiangella]|uniref:hypothetical protein n=1 Tax=unclassified Wenzhouxiangella TaxID=2613841 RepID=UPI000E32C643|nr:MULTISPECIES: hypothetical protein [unclassified Wenzhouxiangella]
MATITLSLLLTGLLVACGDRSPDAGLIRAPEFSDDSGRLARPWRFAHHATTDSYRLEIRDGIATIERTGPEPWSQLVQPVPPEQLDSLAGRRLAFSMDIRARLENETFGPPLEPTALTVRMWNKPAAASAGALGAMLGSRQAESERLALPHDAQISDWRRVTLEFTVPEDIARMEVAAIMASGGRLELRNPALHPL